MSCHVLFSEADENNLFVIKCQSDIYNSDNKCLILIHEQVENVQAV